MGKRGPKPKRTDQDYVDAITRFREEHGYPPSYRDLAKELEVAACGQHAHRINRLVDIGMIRKTPGVSRSLVVIQ